MSVPMGQMGTCQRQPSADADYISPVLRFPVTAALRKGSVCLTGDSSSLGVQV